MRKPTTNQLFNPRNFIPYWMAWRGLTWEQVKARTGLISEIRLDYADIYKVYVADFIQTTGAKKVPKPLTKLELEDGLTSFLFTEDQRQRELVVEHHKVQTETLEPLKAFVTALTGRGDEIDLAVMAHWLWTVKRRSRGYKSVYELMPILVGKQGGGKSQAVRMLINSWGITKITLKLGELSDNRIFEGLSKSFIAFADELEGADRADMNSLKNQITAETNSFRELHTHNIKTVPMVCSFIGASNRKINEVFNDPSGMRRFYEVACQDKLDWDTLNKLDYVALWRGIDENRERGYMTVSVLDQLVSIQSAITNKSEIAEFLEDLNLMPTDDKFVEVRLEELYNKYRNWAAESGIHKPNNKQWFSRRVINHGLPTYVGKTSTGFTARFFKINSATSSAQSPQHTILEFKK